MSATDGTSTPDKKDEPPATFTDKEERVLKLAWTCLDSGPPAINLKKLTQVGGFNTEKTCSNTWGVIKKKLAAMAVAEGIECDDNAGTKTPKTPTGKTTPKKRAKKAEGDGDNDRVGTGESTGSPKKARKTPSKKSHVTKRTKAESDDDGIVTKKEAGAAEDVFTG